MQVAKTVLAAATALTWGALCIGAAHAATLIPFSNSKTAEPPTPWHVVGLPERYAKPLTQFDVIEMDGVRVLRVRADKSYANLVHAFQGSVASIEFRWRLDVGLDKANLSVKSAEDAPLKVCLSFDMPASHIPLSERTLFRFAQFFSPDKLPTATLCYAWDQRLPIERELASPYTGRVRYLVLDNGHSPLKTWLPHTRNVATDFKRAFGTEIDTVPAVTAIIVSADADNTQGVSLGYISDILIKP